MMPPEERDLLLSRYATGGLTPAERARLLEASLDDPELFALLAEEEALRDLLEDPAVRGEVVAALTPAAKPWYARPWAWAAAAPALAGLLVVGFYFVQKPVAEEPVTMAQVQAPQTLSAPIPEAKTDLAAAPAPPRKTSKADAATLVVADATKTVAPPPAAPGARPAEGVALASNEVKPNESRERNEPAPAAVSAIVPAAGAAAPPPAPKPAAELADLAKKTELAAVTVEPSPVMRLKEPDRVDRATAPVRQRAEEPSKGRVAVGAVFSAKESERKAASKLFALAEVQVFKDGRWASIGSAFEVAAGTPIRFRFATVDKQEVYRVLPDGPRVLVPEEGWTPQAAGEVEFILEPNKSRIKIKVR